MSLPELKQSAVEKFISTYGFKPDRIIIAPGRVNLIGEHIDYNGFGVLPFAVARYTVIAVGIVNEPVPPALSICHVDSENFPSRKWDRVLSVPKDEHHWTNYCLAAYLGVTNSLSDGASIPSGLCLAVTGNLPKASGLSSSSSLVVASAMAFAPSTIGKKELAEICMQAEWHVGTAGGGMDQAAILLSEPGFAIHINFGPLRTSLAKLPIGSAFIVANAMARSAKVESAATQYNKRVFECKIGGIILRKINGLSIAKDVLTDTIADIQKEKHDLDLSGLPWGPVSKNVLESLVGMVAINSILDGRCGQRVWEVNSDFHIGERVRHVLTEAKRVVDFANATDVLTCARLMNESNVSCDRDYDCSCPELRELTALMIEAGCTGARLTGAGWGGCAVGIVPVDIKDYVISAIKAEYYVERRGITETDDLLFASEPVGGASITLT